MDASGKSALEKAIADAETAMNALKLSNNPDEKRKLRQIVQRRMQEAEGLKSAAASAAAATTNVNSASLSTAGSLKEPQSTRQLDRSEQILLLKASYLNGDKFPPWTSDPTDVDFMLSEDQPLYEDAAHFSLSAYQQKVFAGWERPAIALARVDPTINHATTTVQPTMQHIGNVDVVQDASTDCSVVASLCAGIARALRGHTRLLRLFPRVDGEPSLSQNGKYIVRLNFNGCYRRVVIDDRLPASRTERIIHVIDRLNPTLLWPALVEKAYLKIRGGYDFPGSNSATDLWVITGWLPEQVFLQSDDLDLAAFWSRISSSFAHGDVLITMGTGKMSKKLEKEVGLAGEHDYAVIDVKEIKGQRLMLVKNPWCEGTNWYRVPQRQLRADIADDELLAQQSPRDLLNTDDQLSPGTFWMDIDNAAQYFESIYLNWNPSLFTHRQDLHFEWDLSKGVGSDPANRLHASLANHPQFAISAAQGGTIWLLLCRHLRNTATSSFGHSVDLSGFTALAAFAAGGKRIKIAGRHITKSNFVDSPQILMKLQDCEPRTAYTILPLEQELTTALHTFTLNVFSSSAVTLGYASAAFPYSAKSLGAWTKDTAGGNAHSAAYSTNPQFKLVMTRPSVLAILLEAADSLLNVHVKLVHGKGERIYSVRKRDILFDSSDYRRRCCTAESKSVVDAGTYTIICSTFEPQQLGTFELLVESDEALSLSALPREGAGRLLLTTKATFPTGITKIAAKLSPIRLANIQVVARSAVSPANSQLSIAIEQGYGVARRVLSSSASDIGEQARLRDFDISPEMLRYGELWIVLERTCVIDQAQDLSMSLDIYVDQSNALTVGQWT